MIKGWFEDASSKKDALGMIRGYFNDDLMMHQSCFKGMFEGCFNEAFLILPLGLMNASRILHQCFKNANKIFKNL